MLSKHPTRTACLPFALPKAEEVKPKRIAIKAADQNMIEGKVKHK